MEITKKPAFDPNTMATTVGANSLNIKTIVSQPSNDQADLMVDGLDYVFDQAKFEEYLSSSSSRSSSPPKHRWILSPKRDVRYVGPMATEVSPLTPANCKVGSSAHDGAFQKKESSYEISTALTKRARQRQRQKSARQLVKALESTDGVHYQTRSHDQRYRQTTAPQPQPVSIPTKQEWVLIKRTRLTKKERAQKRRARIAHARAIIRKSQELRSAQSSKVWIPKSAQNPTRKMDLDSAFERDSHNCRGRRNMRDSHNCLGQSRDTSKCRAQSSFSRDTSRCRAQRPFDRDTSNCLGQGGSPSRCPIASLTVVMLNCLGPRPGNQGKTSAEERRHTGGPDQAGTSQLSKVPIASRLSIPQGVRESSQLNGRHPQKKTCLSIKDNVTLWGGTTICNKPHQPRHQAGGGDTRKRTIDKINCSCSCAQLIKTLLSGCACSESKSLSRRASVFKRLSLPTTEESKPRPRRFRSRRSAIQRNELSEVTINMVGKGKGEAATDTDPDFTPEGKVGAQISRRLSRLQRRAATRINYRRMHEGESSEDETSDSCSAIASDDTMSSVGQAREAYTITPETLAQMLQEALAKQREELRAEMKMEMELAMQQMRELQSQKAAQPESSQQGGSSRRVAHEIEDSDTEVDEHILADQLPKKTAEGLNHPTESNLKPEEDGSGKMKELEGKINALMSAQEVKKTGIPCPYPREWDSIPYPSKFNLINFTPFDGRGSPTQHLIYFKSHLGVISGNEPLMVRSFVGTLRGAAFDWYRRLKAGSINCWDDMESSFLNNFFDDETEVSIGTLLDEKQKSGETIDCFVKRFRNKAMNCKDPVTEEFILQTCHNNLSLDLLKAVGVTPPTTWKDLKIRGEQAERFLRRKKAERGKTTADPSEANAVDVSQTSQPRPRQQPREQQKASKSEFHGTYSFKDEEVPIILKHLLDSNKIKLPPITNQEEADKTSDPKYCAYHRRVHHPTKSCFVLKDSIQALIDAGIIMSK